MKFKRIVLSILLASVVIVTGLGIAQKTYSAHQFDDTHPPSANESYPSPDDTPLFQQVGDTFGIVLGAIAIVLTIGLGVGFNYRSQGKGQK